MLFPNLKRESRKREVNRGIENLRKKGLLDECGKVTIEEKHHHLWRDADHLANPRSRSDLGYASLRELVVDALADASYQCKIFKDLQGLGKRLDEYEHFMKIAGYSQSQILDYWHEVVFAPGYCHCQCRPLEAFVAKGFMPVFNIAEERTSRNRISGSYTGISLGCLWGAIVEGTRYFSKCQTGSLDIAARSHRKKLLGSHGIGEGRLGQFGDDSIRIHGAPRCNKVRTTFYDVLDR